MADAPIDPPTREEALAAAVRDVLRAWDEIDTNPKEDPERCLGHCCVSVQDSAALVLALRALRKCDV